MITLQSSCGRGTRASRCWSIRMMLLLYTHTVQNWRRTSNLDKSLSNSETSTTALTMWFQQTTYEPATRTVPRFKTHYVLGQSLEWKNERLEIVVVQAMEVISSYYDVLYKIYDIYNSEVMGFSSLYDNELWQMHNFNNWRARNRKLLKIF